MKQLRKVVTAIGLSPQSFAGIQVIVAQVALARLFGNALISQINDPILFEAVEKQIGIIGVIALCVLAFGILCTWGEENYVDGELEGLCFLLGGTLVFQTAIFIGLEVGISMAVDGDGFTGIRVLLLSAAVMLLSIGGELLSRGCRKVLNP